jgi:ABC-type glutathione transport system ATPase component
MVVDDRGIGAAPPPSLVPSCGPQVPVEISAAVPEATDMAKIPQLPQAIEVRGVRHNTLRDLDIDVPLWRTVVVAGVSGSGKTSLAMGTLYDP